MCVFVRLSVYVCVSPCPCPCEGVCVCVSACVKVWVCLSVWRGVSVRVKGCVCGVPPPSPCEGVCVWIQKLPDVYSENLTRILGKAMHALNWGAIFPDSVLKLFEISVFTNNVTAQLTHRYCWFEFEKLLIWSFLVRIFFNVIFGILLNVFEYFFTLL